MQNAARALNQNPNLFIARPKNGYLFYQGSALVPYQRYMAQGLFIVKSSIVDNIARYQTYITPKGLEYFSRKYSMIDNLSDEKNITNEVQSICSIFIKSWGNSPTCNISANKIKRISRKTEKSSINTELELQQITQSKMNERLLSRREASEFLGGKENTLAIWKLTNRQIIPTYKIGKFIKYKASDLQKFLDGKLI